MKSKRTYLFMIDKEDIPRFGILRFSKFAGLTNVTKQRIVKDYIKYGWSVVTYSEYKEKMKEFPSHIGFNRIFEVDNPEA